MQGILLSIATMLVTSTLAMGQGGGLEISEEMRAQLGSAAILTISQSQDGFLWIGSERGLHRYDGYQLRPYRIPDEGDGLSVTALMENESGELVVGTNRGLFVLDLDTESITKFGSQAEHSDALTPGPVISLLMLSNGVFLAGTEGGLNQVYPSGYVRQFTVDPGRPSLASNSVSSILRRRNGDIWVGTAAGLQRFDPASGEFRTAFLPEVDCVMALYEDSRNRLWIGTRSNGVFRIDDGPSGQLTQPVAPGEISGEITTITETSDQALWTATTDGLVRMEEGSDERTTFRFAENVVSALHEDGAGNLWVGTWGGLHRIGTPNAFEISHPDFGWPANVVAVEPLQTKPDLALIGTSEGSVWIWNRATREWTRRYEARTEISDVVEGVNGSLWVATAQEGLRMVSPNGDVREYRSPELSSDLIRSILFDKERFVWVSTVNGGLNRIDLETSRIDRYKHDDQDASVGPVHRDLAFRLWIGTIGGGLTKALETGVEGGDDIVTLRNGPDITDVIGDDQVLSISEDPTGHILVGTYAGGVTQYDPVNGTARRFDVESGLSNSSVSCVAQAVNSAHWVGTLDGLNRVDFRRQRVRSFGTAEGIESTKFSPDACATMGNELVFGTSQGLLVFDPSNVIESEYDPNVVITDIELFGESMDVDTSATRLKELTLSHDENFVAFEFAALDFSRPESNVFEFQLQGVDREWVAAGTRRYASYPSLAPGEYVFRVRGSNHDRVFGSSEAGLRLKIRHPFWQRAWFRLLVLLAFGAFIAVVAKQKKRLDENAMEIRSAIARDLHDEVSSEISALALDIELKGRSEVAPQELAGSASESVRGIGDLVRDVIWLIREGDLTIRSFCANMETQANRILADKKVVFNQPLFLPDRRLISSQQRHLPFLFKEILHNIHRHSQATEVEITVALIGESASVSIQDNGIGFDPAAITDGTGLSNMEERSHKAAASLSIHARPNHGTHVRFMVHAN